MSYFQDNPNTKADDIHFIVQALGPPIITLASLLLTGVIITSNSVSDALKNTLGIALPTTALAGYFGVSHTDDRKKNEVRSQAFAPVNEPLPQPQESQKESDIGY